MNAGHGLRVGRLVILSSILLRDGIEAVELHGFKWIVGGWLPDSVAQPEEVTGINHGKCN